MKVYVNTKKVKLEKNYIINRGEYRANPLEFEFSNEYADLIKKVRFVNDKETIENTITGDACYIPETMSNSKKFELRVYAYEMQGDDLILRYSPTYAKVFTREGSYQSDATPIEIEKLNIVPMQREQNFKGLYDEVNVEAIQSDELNITPSNEEQTFTGLYDTVSVEAIPPIEAETLNATSSTQNQSFSGLYDEVNIAGIQTDTLNVTPSQTQQQFTGLYDTVNVGAIQAESLNITPTKEAQTRTGLYNQVNVSGDNNLVASNIKKNVSIFGVTGSYEETPNLQAKSVTITENGTQTVSPDSGYDGLSSVSVTTNVSSEETPGIVTNSYTGYSLNNNIGFAGKFMKSLAIQLTRSGWNFLFYDFQGLEDLNFEYSEKPTNMYATFRGCFKLKKIPTIDTSETTILANTFQDCREITELPITVTTKATIVSQMCNGCSKLTTVPYLDLSNVTGDGTTLMFSGCSSLSTESLNNILASLATATQVDQARKTLKNTGLTSAQATTCQGLSNYQAFLDAGWTTGY